ncbi:hypothetical protein AM228_26785 [Planktothricoides sp. SR001]|uniref:hypothetical protein n=1 Tax=Planktothricoides sp. SR001 TaxID=1705388 RepID=UPI0006C1B1AA|nr:hypothetical protein [Planktothricoides sp. SR001]KOR33967.1 hypothetical protein AM228_26785 [Planktothricoides sp. SR001]
MNNTENLGDKFGKLFNTIKNAGEKISQAWEEQGVQVDTFSSIHRGTLDFDLLEADIKNIHRSIQQKGDSVLGSRLVLDQTKKMMEIKTYSQKGDHNFVNTVTAEVNRVINIPADILDEMKTKGRVELSLKFRD